MMIKEEMRQTVEIRRVQPSEMQAAIRLADFVFRDYDPAKKSFEKSHPQLFAPGLCQSFAAFADGKPVSFIGLVPSIVRIGEARLHCCSIGGVCTHPDHRGSGHAGLVLQKVLEHIDRSGASLLLVSGNRSLYTRANCFPFGSFRNYKLDRAAATAVVAQNRAAGITIRELDAADWFGLRNAAEARSVAFEQSLWDLALLLAAEPVGAARKLHHQVLVAEQDGIVQAFAVIGVPYPNATSAPCAFEWAGEAPLVASLFAEAVHRCGIPQLSVPVSWHDKPLIDVLEGAAVAAELGKNNGTVHIVRPERLLRQLQPYLRQIDAHTAGRLHIESSADGTVRLQVDGRTADLDARSLVSLMFDPEPEIQMDEALYDSLRSLFPLPFPYAGGLNYV